jgi:hypothetical protein
VVSCADPQGCRRGSFTRNNSFTNWESRRRAATCLRHITAGKFCDCEVWDCLSFLIRVCSLVVAGLLARARVRAWQDRAKHEVRTLSSKTGSNDRVVHLAQDARTARGGGQWVLAAVFTLLLTFSGNADFSEVHQTRVEPCISAHFVPLWALQCGSVADVSWDVGTSGASADDLSAESAASRVGCAP